MDEEGAQTGSDVSGAMQLTRQAIAAAAPGQQRMMIQRAFGNGRFGAWEAASVEEREMCMHLPQGELVDALDSGQDGVKQLLECVRVSLMVEEKVGALQGAQKEKNTRGKQYAHTANVATEKSPTKKAATAAGRAEEATQRKKEKTD